MAYGKSGSEFLVPTTIYLNQEDPKITALSNGGFVVTWTDFSHTGGDTSMWAVRAQVHSASGARVGGEILVNTNTFLYQYEPAITALSNGGFVISWTDYSETGGDTSAAGVRGQVFAADGSRSGGELFFNATTTNSQENRVLAGLSNGSFVAVWRDSSRSNDYNIGWALRGQLFNPDGTRSGSEFLINQSNYQPDPAHFPTFNHDLPSVAALNNGGFVVTWQQRYDEGKGSSVGQMYAADGSRVGSEFGIASSTATTGPGAPHVAALSSGGFVAIWSWSPYGLHGQLFANDGTRVGSGFSVIDSRSTSNPNITVLSDGNFVVTWEEYNVDSGDADSGGVHGRLFTAGGTAVGSEFLVNTTTRYNQTTPTIAALTGGGFAVAWRDYSFSSDDPLSVAIRAQVFANSSGSDAPVYRFFNVDTGFHFYTASASERDSVMQNLPQFHYEGEAFNAASSPAPGTSPVYRFFHKGLGNHFYTASETERNSIMNTLSHIYSYEGTSYYAFEGNSQSAPAAGATAVYRFFNYQRGSHFFTASSSERYSVIANLSGTFRYEGIGYYVPASSTTSASAAAAGESLYDTDATAFFGAGPASDAGDRLGAGAAGAVFDDGRSMLSSTLLAVAPSVQSMTGDLVAGFSGQDPNPIWH
ncbi:hypothetical protein [Azospirillum sp. TSO22-1]|uniref:hypothetical protein n=1 Tax=Azospirillum sp. TSO22-1 TaxID=716789 RepID=UPI000D60AF8F|nr:hypothetical protein [Azospirillum sp. TSO22-1]PWC41164.1 hypothetical protein TSO221_24210 [Azospirillum sp. TSO22-1]